MQPACSTYWKRHVHGSETMLAIWPLQWRILCLYSGLLIPTVYSREFWVPVWSRTKRSIYSWPE
jgi:hypothetical protein